MQYFLCGRRERERESETRVANRRATVKATTSDNEQQQQRSDQRRRSDLSFTTNRSEFRLLADLRIT